LKQPAIVIFNNSLFINNSPQQYSLMKINGNNNSELRIYNSVFELNTGIGEGGVIDIDYRASKVTIFNSSFISNGANVGGVLRITSWGFVEIDSCWFENNFGVVASIGTFVDSVGLIKNSTFVDNLAVSSLLFLFNENPELTIFDGSLFKSNKQITKLEVIEEAQFCIRLCSFMSIDLRTLT